MKLSAASSRVNEPATVAGQPAIVIEPLRLASRPVNAPATTDSPGPEYGGKCSPRIMAWAAPVRVVALMPAVTTD